MRSKQEVIDALARVMPKIREGENYHTAVIRLTLEEIGYGEAYLGDKVIEPSLSEKILVHEMHCQTTQGMHYYIFSTKKDAEEWLNRHAFPYLFTYQARLWDETFICQPNVVDLRRKS